MQVKASLKNLRISPRKTKLVADLIKGLDVKDALLQLDVTVKRSVPQLRKLLLSALSNGENNLGIDKDNMYIFDVVVGSGPTMKRWMPKAYGRAGQIRKRTSKVEIILEERVEGKGRKSKEQIEQEKKKRSEEKRKAEKSAAEKEKEQEGKEVKKGETKIAAKEVKSNVVAGGEKKGGLTSKIFRRKSM